MRKDITPSFTLLEVLVALFLFTSISLLVSRWLVTVHDMTARAQKVSQAAIKRALCFDIMWRDLVCAQPKESFWDAKKIIFRTRDCDVQFFVKKNKLYRRVGQYNFAAGRWIKKSSCVVFNDFFVEKIAISLRIAEGGVIGVFLQWEQEKKKYIALRNDRTVRSYSTC